MTRLVRRVFTVTAALFAAVVLLAPNALASVTLGQTCTGSFGSQFAFTLNAGSAVPAGSTWSITVSRTASPRDLQVVSDNAAVQGTQAGPNRVDLRAPSGVPAGTVVTLHPRNFLVPTSGSANILTFSGYGGSTSASFSSSSQPC